jgi:hypothetical protein
VHETESIPLTEYCPFRADPYEGPDRNSVELNVSNYAETWASIEHIQNSPEFAHRPLGVDVDPEKLVAAYETGASPWELTSAPGMATSRRPSPTIPRYCCEKRLHNESFQAVIGLTVVSEPLQKIPAKDVLFRDLALEEGGVSCSR